MDVEDPPPKSGFDVEEVFVVAPSIPANPIMPEPSEVFDIEEPNCKEDIWESEDEPNVEMEQPDPEVETEVDASIPLDLQPIAEQLFGGDTGSTILASKVFNARFRGKFVRGSGVLTRVGKFSYDPVFKNKTGVKATFMIGELTDAYSKIKIMAEVKYASEDYDSLKEKVGQSLPIAGNLIAQDAMLKHLVLRMINRQ